MPFFEISIRQKIAAAPNIKKKLIQFTIFLNVTLFLVILVLYYSSMKNTYMEQLEASNGSMLQQVGISYETVMKYIRDSVYKTALYDTDLSNLIQNYDGSTDQKRKIGAKLDSLALFNEFIYSAYLYFPELDVIYSTVSNRTDSLFTFSDPRAFDMARDKNLYNLDPRIVEDKGSQLLLLSIVSAVPLTESENKAFLSINIDARKLYYDMIKKIKAEPNMDFYAYNQDNTIVLNKDEQNLFLQVNTELIKKNSSTLTDFRHPFQSNQLITSQYFSNYLKWTFILDTKVESSKGMNAKLSRFIILSLSLIMASLIFMVFIISIYTKPVKGMLKKYNERLWVDFLTDHVYFTEDVKKNLEDEEFPLIHSRYGSLLLQVPPHSFSEKELEGFTQQFTGLLTSINPTRDCKFKVLAMDKDLVCILLCFSSQIPSEDCHKVLWNLSEKILSNPFNNCPIPLYASISTIKEQFSLLPLSYKECIEVLNYKLTSATCQMDYAQLQRKTNEYAYPSDLEKQLINNLLVGNGEACVLYTNQFFKAFEYPEIKIDDHKIRSSIYRLQNAVLKNISGLPIPIKIDTTLDIVSPGDMGEIKNLVSKFFEKLIQEISKKDENEEYRLYNTVLEYVETRYTQEDMSLNKAADDLNMNKNYFSKIIKEKTGDYFPDYINKKRIALAKELLMNKKKTIEDIAKEVGYNYSYYFIKIFKNIEGITPGQYRSKDE
jgi:AraC-like DNA-binding protein